MFDFNQNYLDLNISMIGQMEVKIVPVSRQKTCTMNQENFLEIFKDNNPDVPLEEIGPVFCDSLNGKLLPMPETFEKFRELQQVVLNYLTKKGGEGLSLVVSGYVFPPEVTKPMFGYPPGGYYQEFREIGTGRLLNITQEAMKKAYNFKEKHDFQKSEKLCVMLGLHATYFIETLYLSCDNLAESITYNPAAVCIFEKKITVKLSGLCTQSPVDKSYILLESRKYYYEGDSYSDHYRYGTFIGMGNTIIGRSLIYCYQLAQDKHCQAQFQLASPVPVELSLALGLIITTHPGK